MLRPGATLPVCIICQQIALNRGTSPEHILLNGLGGRKTTRIAICTPCNNKFGRTIDKALLDQVVFLRNLLNLRSGDGKDAPSRKNVTAGKKKVTMAGDGTLKLTGKPFEFSKNPDGSFNIQFNVNSEREIAEILPHVSAATGVSQDRLIDAILAGDGKIVHTRPDAIFESTQFGGEEANRSMVKAAFVLWATKASFEEPHKDVYDEARNFIKVGSQTFNTAHLFMDTRSHKRDAEIVSRFGPCFNSIYVQSNAAGEVVGRFTLYNAVSWKFTLAESGGVADRSIGLINNPLSTADWTDRATELYSIPFEWIDVEETVVDFGLTKQRLDRIMKFYAGRGRESEVSRIVEDVCSQLAEGDRITPAVISEISRRVAHYALSIPYETPLDKDRLRAAFKGRKAP